MVQRNLVKLVLFLLQHTRLSKENRNLLTTGVLDKLAALPLHDIITTNEEGSLLINGHDVDYETASKLRASAKGALDNYAQKFIDQQILYIAITSGVHKLENVDQAFFMRAAIWSMQQREAHLKLLAGDNRELAP